LEDLQHFEDVDRRVIVSRDDEDGPVGPAFASRPPEQDFPAIYSGFPHPESF
jgi:hypothetical protein